MDKNYECRQTKFEKIKLMNIEYNDFYKVPNIPIGFDEVWIT